MWVQSYATVIYNSRSSRPHCIVSVNYTLSDIEFKELQLSEDQSPVARTCASTQRHCKQLKIRTVKLKPKRRTSPHLQQLNYSSCSLPQGLRKDRPPYLIDPSVCTETSLDVYIPLHWNAPTQASTLTWHITDNRKAAGWSLCCTQSQDCLSASKYTGPMMADSRDPIRRLKRDHYDHGKGSEGCAHPHLPASKNRKTSRQDLHHAMVQ